MVGAENVMEFEPTMGAEDFSYFLLEKPGCYFLIGNGDGSHREGGHGLGPCMLHNPSYDEARMRFLEAAEAVRLDVESHVHPMLGRDGETLAMDVVRDGPREAAALLIVSSACHGVEGFCGSGVQVALLSDPAWRSAARNAGVAVLYIHALNPY